MNILFVCLGNICRSPTAEAVLKHYSGETNLDLYIDSAGTGGWHTGEPPDKRARAAGQLRGYRFDGQRARKIQAADFENFDYILAMDRHNMTELTAISPAEHRHKLKLFLDYAPQQNLREVPDPFYGGEDGFEKVIDVIELASQGLILALKK